MLYFNSNLKKPQSQLQAGFIMLEVACALVLVGILSFLLLEWYTAVVYAQRTLTQRAHALTLACSILEQYRATGTWNKHELHHELRELQRELQEMTITKEYRPDTHVRKFGWITVKITWKDRGITRSIELHTGVHNQD
jgi:type II secretory pathway pseudopilin PulG